MINERQKICPKCKTGFGCFITDCWCAELPPIMELLPEAECYCPLCLKEIVDKKIANVRS